MFEYPQRVQFTDPVKAQPLMQFQENLRRALKPLVDAAMAALTPGPSQTLAGGGLIPVGTEIGMRTAVAPAGWLLLAGQLMGRANYPNLWALVSNPANGFRVVTDAAWGAGTPPDKGAFSSGDGSTTFRLPDPRGLFERVMDGGAGVDPDTASRNPAGASVIGSAQADAMQGHYHNMKFGNGAPSNALNFGGAPGANNSLPAGVTSTNTIAVDAPNSDGTHGAPRVSSETRPVNYYVNKFIKY